MNDWNLYIAFAYPVLFVVLVLIFGPRIAANARIEERERREKRIKKEERQLLERQFYEAYLEDRRRS